MGPLASSRTTHSSRRQLGRLQKYRNADNVHFISFEERAEESKDAHDKMIFAKIEIEANPQPPTIDANIRRGKFGPSEIPSLISSCASWHERWSLALE